VIWTTTPWTLPANLGLAVHPQLKYSVAEFEGRPDRALLLLEDLVAEFEEATGWKRKAPGGQMDGRELENLEARHPFLDRTSKVMLADFVTTDTGTGVVHMCAGHGADDYMIGRQYGLDVLSPVDDDGNFTAECGLPELVGRAGVQGERADHRDARAARRAAGAGGLPPPVPALLALEDADHLPRGGAVLHRDRRAARRRARGDRQGQLAAGLGREPDRRHRRGAARLVHLAPAHLGSAAAGVLRRGRRGDRRCGVARKLADLVESEGTNVWFEKSDAELAAELGLPEGVRKCRDTLDVWIDSGCSHLAVLDRHPELHAPADLYLEATDQHRGWFQSSLMLSIACAAASPTRR
jgi:isoleucyl-tRNA synthetase